MLVTLTEYAQLHGKSPDTISRMVRNGVLLTTQKNGRFRAIDSDEIYPANKSSDKNQISVLSLFSGCGGLDLGFEGDFDVLEKSVNSKVNPDWRYESSESAEWVHLPKTRFHTVFANDIKPDAKTAWNMFFRTRGIDESTYMLDSIVNLVKAHKTGQSVFPMGVDVVTGGFPCQDFSIAGKRLGFNSDKYHSGGKIDNRAPSIENRGQLYMWMREVISLTLPKVFIAENVKGLTNLADVKSIIEEDFRSIGGDGYLVMDARVIHAADYGVPQSRERVVFVGFRKSALNKKAHSALSLDDIDPLYDPYPLRTHAFTSFGDILLPPTTLLQAFVGLGEPDESGDKAHQKYSKAKYMGKHCQGQTEIDLYRIGPTIRSEHHGNIEFRRLSEEHGGKQIGELNSGLAERRLSVRECARIQTFPDDYEFIIQQKNGESGVSASSAYKLIGNAVPPLLGYHIAKRLEKNWGLYFGGTD